VDQVLKLLVLKQLPPFLDAERFRHRLFCLSRCSSTVRTRNVYVWPLIIGPHSAARKKEHDQGKSDKFSHLSLPPRGLAAEQQD
jgi:hypothetical protein